MPGGAYIGHGDHDDHDEHDDHDRHDDKLGYDCEDDWGKNKRPREQKCLALCIHRTPSTSNTPLCQVFISDGALCFSFCNLNQLMHA